MTGLQTTPSQVTSQLLVSLSVAQSSLLTKGEKALFSRRRVSAKASADSSPKDLIDEYATLLGIRLTEDQMRAKLTTFWKEVEEQEARQAVLALPKKRKNGNENGKGHSSGKDGAGPRYKRANPQLRH